MKYNKIIFIFLFLILVPSSSSAFYRNGLIDGKFGHESLEISKKGYLTGYIVNRSSDSYRNLSFTVSGRHGGSSIINWDTYISIGSLKPGEKYPFSKYIGRGHKSTYKIIFKKYSGSIEDNRTVSSHRKSQYQEMKGRIYTNEQLTSVRISGEGPQMSQVFTLKKGLNVFKYKHKGDGHFSITLIDKQGEYEDLIANDIGHFSGSKGINIRRKNKYIVNIKADPGAEWLITVDLPESRTSTPAFTRKERPLKIIEDKNGVIHIKQ